jgi:hypothetical protein
MSNPTDPVRRVARTLALGTCLVVATSGTIAGTTAQAAPAQRAVQRRLIGRILAHPRRYYLNVHNAPYPAGAIQGRLHH